MNMSNPADSFFKGKELLLLEDDLLLRKRLQAKFEEMEVDVTACESLAEARSAFDSLHFDFALFDLNLPDGDSLELLRDGVVPESTLTILMTGEGGVRSAVEAIRLGAADYLNKPFDLDELRLIFANADSLRKLSIEDARKKLDSLRKEMAKKGEFKRPVRPQRPAIPDDVKESMDSVKELEKSLHEEIKAKVEELGKDATREEIKVAVESFKETNKERFEEIKEKHEAIREKMKDSRPVKPERPELSDELKAKVDVLQEKRKEMHEAQKELHQNLKEASEEDRKQMIAEFKETNKAKHEEIKSKTKEVKEEIRALVETEATRTSDL